MNSSTVNATVTALLMSADLFLAVGCGREESEAPIRSTSVEGQRPATEEAGSPQASDESASAVTRGPSVPRVEPGAITVDGRIEEWAERQIPLYPAFPPRPIEGEPQTRQEQTTLRMWSTRVESAQTQGMALAHDGRDLYIILTLATGIQEEWEATHSTGALGYIYMDTDGDSSTGKRRELYGKAAGFDRRVWLPTGFYGGTGVETRPMAAYEVTGYSGEEYEDIPGGEKETHEEPEFIAFGGRCLEMRIPFDVLGITPPTILKLSFSHLGFTGDSSLLSLRVE